jgi:hypothetical protein
MNQISRNSRRWTTLMSTVVIGFALSVGVGCQEPTEGGMGKDFDEECRSCRTDGDTCVYSINCAPGSICNDPADPYYVADADNGICIKVICDSDSDCVDGKTCNPEKICEAPLCQTDDECAAGNYCSGGECLTRPDASQVASCAVISGSHAIREAQTVDLTATAKNTNGAVLGAIEFKWTSDKTDVASTAGSVATGASASGTAKVTAVVSGNESVACTGEVSITNFATLGMGEGRVIAAASKNGAPIAGATVWMATTSTTMMGTTGADGSVVFSGVAGDVSHVTVQRDGWQSVSVLSPGTNDVYLLANKKPDRTVAGGFRGAVDLSATKRADIKLAIAGPALPANVLDLELESLLGDSIETVINAPDLGLTDEKVDLPGGIMLALGTQTFTDDSASSNLRCQGDAPPAGSLGCYVSRSPEGPSAAWVLGGQLKLSAISSIAGQLSGVLGGGGSDELPIGDLLTALLPLLRSMSHGVNAGLDITNHPKVNTTMGMGDCSDPSLSSYDANCQGDFSKYDKISLATNQRLRLLSAVAVPKLPVLPKGGFAAGVMVIAGAVIPGRGLLPLGLTAGIDVEKEEVADGFVFGASEPFGPNSEKLADGEVALAMAPLHSGIEAAKLQLISIALDPNSIASSGGTQLSTIINRVARVGEKQAITGEFLGFPTGTFDTASAKFTPTGTGVAGAQSMRMVVTNSSTNDEWLIYVPNGASAEVTLPNVAAVKNQVISGTPSVLLQVMNTSAAYNEMFTLGSAKSLSALPDTLDSFVIQDCATGADEMTACKIQ